MASPQNRPNAGTFQKGQSGNPGGRPKAAIQWQELAREKTAENLTRIVSLAETAMDESVRLRASQYLHEIAWGKPAQAVNVSGSMTHEAGTSILTILRNGSPDTNGTSEG